jgi:pullulanase/glycogen debranching enzyme
VSWLHPLGRELAQNDWQDANLRTLGILLANRSSTAHHLLFLVNAADHAVQFMVPAASADAPWVCRFDTAREHGEIRELDFSAHYPLVASSAALLEC